MPSSPEPSLASPGLWKSLPLRARGAKPGSLTAPQHVGNHRVTIIGDHGQVKRSIVLFLVLALAMGGCGRLGDDRSSGSSTEGLADASSGAPDPTRGVDRQPGGEADPLRQQQWGLDVVRAEVAWQVSTGAGVVIAVVDTGVDGTHPDLASRLVPGVDLVDPAQTAPVDPHGHGTHVAGIAAAATGNGLGVAGGAPAARIMPVRVLGPDGTGDDQVIADGIDWAVEHGAGVVNLSLGESGVLARLSKNGPLNAAIRRADNAGVVVVAAAGNDGATRQSFRLGVPVIVVNASTPDGRAAEFSTTGDVRAVAAPGTGIVSTAPTAASTLWADGTDGYAALDGTSMAAPLVSAVAALLVAQGLDPAQVAERLSDTASHPTDDPGLGAGVVDAAAAVGAATPRAHGAGAAASSLPWDGPRGRPAAAVGASPATPEDGPGVPHGSGSLTVQLSAPVALHATVATDVNCAETAMRYTAQVSSASVGNGYQLAASITVTGYRGPGDYPGGTVLVTLTSSNSTVPVPLAAPVDLTDTGGSATLSSTDGALAGTIAWTCG